MAKLETKIEAGLVYDKGRFNERKLSLLVDTLMDFGYNAALTSYHRAIIFIDKPKAVVDLMDYKFKIEKRLRENKIEICKVTLSFLE